VLLYPDDETEISEPSSQPFVADYLQDVLEARPDLAAEIRGADSVLIENFDAVVMACLGFDRPRSYTVLYHRPAFVQKQAQAIWNYLAVSGRVDQVKQIRLLSAASFSERVYGSAYHLIYAWVAFSQYDQPAKLAETIQAIGGALRPGGLAFIVGPSSIHTAFHAQGLRIIEDHAVATLPPFRMHQTILPRARLKSGLTLFLAVKHGASTRSGS
jgi:hypothetical protein